MTMLRVMMRGGLCSGINAFILAVAVALRMSNSFVIPRAIRVTAPASPAHTSQPGVGRVAQVNHGRITRLVSQVAGETIESAKDLSTDEDSLRTAQIRGFTDKVGPENDLYPAPI